MFSVSLWRRDRPMPVARAASTSGRAAWFSIAATPSIVSDESPTTRPSGAINVTRASSSSPHPVGLFVQGRGRGVAGRPRARQQLRGQPGFSDERLLDPLVGPAAHRLGEQQSGNREGDDRGRERGQETGWCENCRRPWLETRRKLACPARRAFRPARRHVSHDAQAPPAGRLKNVSDMADGL